MFTFERWLFGNTGLKYCRLTQEAYLKVLAWIWIPSKQDPHCTGKNRENGLKNSCHGKHWEFGNFAKTQGILFAQVIRSLILAIYDTVIFAAKSLNYFESVLKLL